MFGAYRTILALVVVLQHFGGVKLVGTLAVFGFFCLSGFLMTLLMDTAYKGRMKDFAINRFLRLYPSYWVTIILVVTLLSLNIPKASNFIGIPSGSELIRAILYINTNTDNPTFVTTGWAVTNEIVWYIAIALGLSKTPTRSTIWLFLSILFTVGVHEFMYGNSSLRYFSPLAASLPFAYGAFLYHFREAFPKEHAKTIAVGSSIILIASLIGTQWSFYLSRYTFLIASGVFAIAMFYVGKETSKAVIKRDAKFGELSYPIYLNHYAAASIVVAFSPITISKPWSFIPIAIISIVVALLTNWLIETPIKRLRDRVRDRKSQSLLPKTLQPASSLRHNQN